MAKQYQIPGGPFVNVTENGKTYALPGYGQLNQAGDIPLAPYIRIVVRPTRPRPFAPGLAR